MKIGEFEEIKQPCGSPVKYVEEAVYLGSLVSTAALAKPEVTRRLGEARAAFQKIRAVWNHKNISKKRETEIYSACVSSKLLFSSECECLRSQYSEHRHLQGISLQDYRF